MAISENIIYEDYGRLFLDEFVGSWPKEASRGVIQFPDGDILIFIKERIGQYKLPGGGKEHNETPEQTFVREVYEETGYKVKTYEKLGLQEIRLKLRIYLQRSHMVRRKKSIQMKMKLDLALNA